jgi:hypothetical protein
MDKININTKYLITVENDVVIIRESEISVQTEKPKATRGRKKKEVN